MHKRLGKVDSVDLEIEDHGILTFGIGLDFGGTHQGIGYIAIDTWSEEHNRRIGTAGGLDLILQIIKFFDVKSLDKIKGKYVYALQNSDGWSEPILGLKLPEMDGGNQFMLDDWRNTWGLNEKKELNEK